MADYFLFEGELFFRQEITKLSLEGEECAHTIDFVGGYVETDKSKKQEIPVYIFKPQSEGDGPCVSCIKPISTVTNHYRLTAKWVQKISIYRFYKLLKENSSQTNSEDLNYPFDVLAILKQTDFHAVKAWLVISPKDNHQDISFHICSENFSDRILSQTSFTYHCTRKDGVLPFFLPHVTLNSYCRQLCSDQKPLAIEQKQKILSRFNIENF